MWADHSANLQSSWLIGTWQCYTWEPAVPCWMSSRRSSLSACVKPCPTQSASDVACCGRGCPISRGYKSPTTRCDSWRPRYRWRVRAKWEKQPREIKERRLKNGEVAVFFFFYYEIWVVCPSAVSWRTKYLLFRGLAVITFPNFSSWMKSICSGSLASCLCFLLHLSQVFLPYE